ncbi:hypothetical protein SERLA73DRAFT_134076 [Serpula lacrymans var. lacrymans S7.3]|uniref:Uncharacterized protein n=1 Tax=Serpula lacrymans var. lacrymans (strain S7.3) TaxID=936435 RepID=F8PTA7_SERL3|nr:hypothetical protein SERLA73DRAFT_134076 [Serpula lacrymans var. lacrymans S7.3]
MVVVAIELPTGKVTCFPSNFPQITFDRDGIIHHFLDTNMLIYKLGSLCS